MKTYVTSDLHFSHRRISEFCPKTRPWTDIAEMNEAMIAEWNAIATMQDTIYILGDVAFGPVVDACKIIKRLNGTKILIEGNHDDKKLLDDEFFSLFKYVANLQEITHTHQDKTKHRIVLCHYPLLQWNGCHNGIQHLYGHLHDNLSGLEEYRAMNVGYDSTEAPGILKDLDWVVKTLESRNLKNHH